MKTKTVSQPNGVKRVALVTAGILMIPLLARFPWSLFDFAIMGVLLFGTGMMIDWVTRNVEKKYQIIATTAVLFAFFIIWAQLAVGLVTQIFTGELWIYDVIRMYL